MHLPDEATSDLAIGAARDCLAKTRGISPKEVDLILVATMTPDHYDSVGFLSSPGEFGCYMRCGGHECRLFWFSLCFDNRQPLHQAGASQEGAGHRCRQDVLHLRPRRQKNIIRCLETARVQRYLELDPNPDESATMSGISGQPVGFGW